MTNIDKIRKLLIDVNNELDYISLADTDNAIYQVYCECNRFIGNEIKRIMREQGTVTKEHPEIMPLYKMLDTILPIMMRFSKIVREMEQKNEKNTLFS